jgi:hypothetical protein
MPRRSGRKMIGSNVSAVGMLEALEAADHLAGTYEDNYSSTLKSIAAFILDHAPEGIRSIYRGSLELVRCGESENLSGIEFRREDSEGKEASADLYVDVDDDNWGSSIRFTDSEGNRWREVSVRVRVSWSSWGSTEVDLASFRLALMTEVATFAREVKEHFSAPVYQLIETKEESAKREEDFRKADLARKVKSVVEAAPERKGMRVEGLQAIPIDRTPAEVLAEPEGSSWSVTVGGGKSALHYVATVSKPLRENGFKVLVLKRVAG